VTKNHATSGLFVGKTNVVCDRCYNIILLFGVLLLFVLKVKNVYDLLFVDYCGINPRVGARLNTCRKRGSNNRDAQLELRTVRSASVLKRTATRRHRAAYGNIFLNVLA